MSKGRWKRIKWVEFTRAVQGLKLKAERTLDTDITDVHGDELGVLLEFETGEKFAVVATCETDYSELTPGAGLSPPVVYARRSA